MRPTSRQTSSLGHLPFVKRRSIVDRNHAYLQAAGERPSCEAYHYGMIQTGTRFFLLNATRCVLLAVDIVCVYVR